MNRLHRQNGYTAGRFGSKSDPALVALREAVAAAIERHRRLGNPIAIVKDGREIVLHPDGREEPITASVPRRAGAKKRARR